MHNPFVEKFRQQSQSPNLHQCKLLIKEQPLNQPQYCLPSASQVAAIIVEGEEAGHFSGRKILVQTFGGNLITVQDTAGYYDPLQYQYFSHLEHMDEISTHATLIEIKCCVVIIMHTSFRQQFYYFQIF